MVPSYKEITIHQLTIVTFCHNTTPYHAPTTALTDRHTRGGEKLQSRINRLNHSPCAASWLTCPAVDVNNAELWCWWREENVMLCSPALQLYLEVSRLARGALCDTAGSEQGQRTGITIAPCSSQWKYNILYPLAMAHIINTYNTILYKPTSQTPVSDLNTIITIPANVVNSVSANEWDIT